MARTPSLIPAPAAYPLPQIPQLQAFSKGAQQTEAALNLANVLAQAYAMSKGRSRRQGRQEALLQAIRKSREPSGWKNPDENWVPPKGVVDMSIAGPDGHLVPESQRGDPRYRLGTDLAGQRGRQEPFTPKNIVPFRPDTAVLEDKTQLRGRDALINSLLTDPDLANLTSDDMTPLLSTLMSEAMEKPKLPTRGEVLSTVPTTVSVQTGVEGPLADPERAFQPITIERKRTAREQFEADEEAVRRAGLLDESWYSPELMRELYKGDVAEDRFYRQEQWLNALKHGYQVEVLREGKSIELEVGRIEAERANDLERKLYEWKAQIDTNKGPEIGDIFDFEQKIRKEYTAVAGDYRDRVGAFNLLMSTEDSPAGDIALVTNFMKMLDPGSVVREGEFAQAAKAVGAPEQVVTALRGFVTGQTLGPTQRADLRAVAMDIYKDTIEKFAPMEAQFRAIAKHYNLDADRILLDWSDEPVTEEQRGKGATVRVGESVREEDIKKGHFYIKDGLLYRKGDNEPWWGVHGGKNYEGGVEVLPPVRD